MEDRVAEVLAQRAAVGSGPAAGVVLSVALHGVLAAAVIYAATHQAPPQMVNTLTINLQPMTPANAAPAVPPKPKAPVIREPQPKLETPPVTATTPPVAPAKNTAPPSPFGKSTKKPANVVPPPATQPLSNSATPTATAPDIAVGSSGVTGLEGGDFPYTIYIENMKRLIGTHWFRPQVANGTALTMYFFVNRDGTIRDVKVETTSGNASFDRAAQRAILESSPLPPLPFGYNGTFLGVHLTFK
jgi:TonB family protein